MNQNLSERVRTKHTRQMVRWALQLGLGACLGSAHGADAIFADGFDGCGPLTRPIYAFDVNNALLRFDPLLLGSPTPIQSLGVPNCNVGPALPGWTGGTTVISMSVDRIGFVWALYSSGEIFTINPATLACANTGYVPAQTADWKLFNMAFAGLVTANEQSLYVSGGSVDMAAVGNLGQIDPVVLTVQTIGVLGGAADFSVPLAGIGTTELFGLYPAISSPTSSTYLRQIDRATGAVVGTPLAVPGFASTTSAWAFTHWGGKFWVFVTTDDGTTQTTTLYSVDRVTGAQQVALNNIAFTPTSAGSSTCVPTTVN
jgi:hypothetical protein